MCLRGVVSGECAAHPVLMMVQGKAAVHLTISVTLTALGSLHLTLRRRRRYALSDERRLYASSPAGEPSE